MNIRTIQIDVLCADINGLEADVKVSECAHLDQDAVRTVTAKALIEAHSKGARSMALTDLGSKEAGFPLVGAAKIMVQEIMRYARNYAQPSLNKIVFCLNEKDTFNVFDQTVRGYIRHIQEKLGPGPYVTVDIIIELEDGIIVIERSNPPFGWALPGGFVDYGESLEEAARREAKEETSLGLNGLRQFHVYSNPNRDPRFHTIATVFIANGEGTPQFGDDAKGLKVVPYEDLPNLEYAFDHKQIIQDYLNQR